MENFRFTKNQLLKSAKQLFQVTEKLIEGQKGTQQSDHDWLQRAYVEIGEFH